MTLYRATADGQIELTPDEESALLAEWAANAATVKVPQSVTMRQARLAIHNAGLSFNVEQAIANANDEITRITWDYAQEVKRNDPHVISIGASMGLTEEQIDNLFIQADAL